MLFNRKAAKDKTLQLQEVEDKLNEKLEALKGCWNIKIVSFLLNNIVLLYLHFKINFCTSDVSASKIASDWSFYRMSLQRLTSSTKAELFENRK